MCLTHQSGLSTPSLQTSNLSSFDPDARWVSPLCAPGASLASSVSSPSTPCPNPDTLFLALLSSSGVRFHSPWKGIPGLSSSWVPLPHVSQHLGRPHREAFLSSVLELFACLCSLWTVRSLGAFMSMSFVCIVCPPRVSTLCRTGWRSSEQAVESSWLAPSFFFQSCASFPVLRNLTERKF